MKKNQSYTAEFRAESVELGTEQNLSHQEAAARLGIPKGSLSNWVQTAKRQGKRVGGSDAMPPTVAELQGKVA
jgi:transposase